jgi:hypothetical protein
LFSPVNTSKEITDVNGATLGMTGGFKDTYKIGDPITMPTVSTVESGFEIVYKVYRGSKVVATLSAGDVFEPQYTGAYNVVEAEYLRVSLFKNRKALLQLPIGNEEVVGIHKLYVSALCLFDAFVACCAWTSMPVCDESYIVLAVCILYPYRGLRRAVVYNDYFVAAVLHTQVYDAPDASRQKLLGDVVMRNYYRE